MTLQLLSASSKPQPSEEPPSAELAAKLTTQKPATTAEISQQPKPIRVVTAEPKQKTQTKLFTDTIKRAMLTFKVQHLDPGDELPLEISLEEGGLSKVYFYTEVLGQAGNTHYHYWYKNDKLITKVPITIGSDRWRCYSSKFLNKHHEGEWKVKIKNRKGKLLAESRFIFRARN